MFLSGCCEKSYFWFVKLFCVKETCIAGFFHRNDLYNICSRTRIHTHTHTTTHTHARTHAHAHTHTHTHVHNYIHEHSYLVSWKEMRETNLSLQAFVLEGLLKSEGSSMWNRLSIFYVDHLDVESTQILYGINSTWNQQIFYVEST